MTDNTPELDEILDQLHVRGCELADQDSNALCSQFKDQAKQSVLDWHNKQIEAAQNEWGRDILAKMAGELNLAEFAKLRSVIAERKRLKGDEVFIKNPLIGIEQKFESVEFDFDVFDGRKVREFPSSFTFSLEARERVEGKNAIKSGRSKKIPVKYYELLAKDRWNLVESDMGYAYVEIYRVYGLDGMVKDEYDEDDCEVVDGELYKVTTLGGE